MSEEKNYLISDEEGNLFAVKDWDLLIKEVSREDLEDIYVVAKYTHSFEEAMIELEERGVIEKIKGGVAPLEEIANSLDRITEEIGVERAKELDEKVKTLLSQKSDDIDPASFMHLN